MARKPFNAFRSFRVYRDEELEKFIDKLDEGEKHPDVDCDDLWDEHEPILRDPSNSHLG